MYTIKQLVARGLLAMEIVLFVGFYFFGAQGRHAITALMADNEHLDAQVQHLQHETDALQHDINDWNTHTWYREKVARESLQMAYPGDEIFLTE